MKIDETIFEKLGVKETGFCQKFRGGGHVNRRHQCAMCHWIAKKMSHQDPFFSFFHLRYEPSLRQLTLDSLMASSNKTNDAIDLKFSKYLGVAMYT